MDSHSWNTMPTVFDTLVCRLNCPNRPVRVSMDYCNRAGRWYTRKLSSTYKRADSLCTYPPQSYSLAFPLFILFTQWRMTASTTILNMVGDNRLPCVTPL